MPTLSMEGSVFQADETSRKELVQFAPFMLASEIVSAPRVVLPPNSSIDIVSNLTAPKVSFICHLVSGRITIKVGHQNLGSSIIANTVLSGTGTFMMLGAVGTVDEPIGGVEGIIIENGGAESIVEYVLGVS